MHLNKVIPYIILIITGLLLISGNLWYTAARSTIPLQIQGTVIHKELRLEKKKGVDDVYMMTLQSGKNYQIDKFLYDKISENSQIEKQAFSKKILIDQNPTQIPWSLDFKRMLFVMSFSIVTLLFLMFKFTNISTLISKSKTL